MPVLQSAPGWIEAEKGGGTDGGQPLHYVEAGAFARHLADLTVSGKEAEVEAALRVIERLVVEGTREVRNLATIGYLEGMQNIALNNGIELDRFERYLGPVSRSEWSALINFWSGATPDAT